jgi:hypothetical protein
MMVHKCCKIFAIILSVITILYFSTYLITKHIPGLLDDKIHLDSSIFDGFDALGQDSKDVFINDHIDVPEIKVKHHQKRKDAEEKESIPSSKTSKSR